MQMHCLFKLVIAKSQIALDTDNNKHLPRSNADGYSHKTHWMIQTMATLNNLVAAKLYNLLFSVLPLSSGTSGYAS